MKTKKAKKPASAGVKRAERDLAGAAGGAAAGAIVGSMAGPAGAIAGAIAGAAMGAIATEGVVASERAKAVANRKLDNEIGISGGEMGAPNLKHPPSKIGAYSSGASGAGDGDGNTVDGPLPGPKD